MQRRVANAFLKAGFSATVSIRALMSREPIEVSLAQDGTSPHLTVVSLRIVSSGCSRFFRSTTATTWSVGATL